MNKKNFSISVSCYRSLSVTQYTWSTLIFQSKHNVLWTSSSTVRPQLLARLCGSCTILTRRFSSKTNHLRRSTLISAPNSAGVASLHASLATIIDGLTFTQSDTLRRRLGEPPKSVHSSSSSSSPLFICKYIYKYVEIISGWSYVKAVQCQNRFRQFCLGFFFVFSIAKRTT